MIGSVDDPTLRAGVDTLERRIARLLTAGTILSVVLLGIGVVLMAVAGISPLDRGFQALDPGRISSDILAMRPEGFLWLGLLVAIATPAGRVLASLVGFVTAGERWMAIVAVEILAVLFLSVVLAVAFGTGA
jgi:uncharacterized membrane protein